MSMQDLMRLKQSACEELVRAAPNGINAGNVEKVYRLTMIAEKLAKLCEMEDGGMSGAGRWSADGTYGRMSYGGNSYDGGSYNSGANRGQHYVRGHYSYDGGASYGGGMMAQMEELMRNASTEREREAIQRAMDEMRR